MTVDSHHQQVSLGVSKAIPQALLDMAADHPAVVEMGLRMKKAGNDLMDTVGGRSVHPVNVKVGGFYRSDPFFDWRASWSARASRSLPSSQAARAKLASRASTLERLDILRFQ